MKYPWVTAIVVSAAAGLALILAASLLQSCTPSSSFIVLRMPEPPESWADLARGLPLSLCLSVHASWGSRLLASGLPFGGRAMVPRESASFAAYLAYPEGPGLGLAPAGLVLPAAGSGGGPASAMEAARGLEGAGPPEFSLSFEDGWSARLAAQLCARDPEAAAYFDWERLREEQTARGGDPWLLDPARVVDEILSRSFSSSALRCMAGEETRIPLSAVAFPIDDGLGGYAEGGGGAGIDIAAMEGAWACSSPFARARLAGGVLTLSWRPASGTVLSRPGARILVCPDPAGDLEAFPAVQEVQ